MELYKGVLHWMICFGEKLNCKKSIKKQIQYLSFVRSLIRFCCVFPNPFRVYDFYIDDIQLTKKLHSGSNIASSLNL